MIDSESTGGMQLFQACKTAGKIGTAVKKGFSLVDRRRQKRGQYIGYEKVRFMSSMYFNARGKNYCG